jgi:hypothetical protein
MNESRIVPFLISSIWSVPFLLLYVTGLVLAITRWPRHPQVSLLSVLAFSAFLIGLLMQRGAWFWYIVLNENHSFTASNTSIVFTAVNTLSSILDFGGWILLLVALFRWRENR